MAFLVGWKSIIGSSGFTLKNSLLYDVGRGVQDEWAGSRDLYRLMEGEWRQWDPGTQQWV